mmetsp:Transcript_927/g.2550  ORF Transcript_927/g.2550 Transcript_927/m.2550 type:complete len:207 (-) Transcript_927:709-1329(-)
MRILQERCVAHGAYLAPLALFARFGHRRLARPRTRSLQRLLAQHVRIRHLNNFRGQLDCGQVCECFIREGQQRSHRLGLSVLMLNRRDRSPDRPPNRIQGKRQLCARRADAFGYNLRCSSQKGGELPRYLGGSMHDDISRNERAALVSSIGHGANPHQRNSTAALHLLHLRPPLCHHGMHRHARTSLMRLKRAVLSRHQRGAWLFV